MSIAKSRRGELLAPALLRDIMRTGGEVISVSCVTKLTYSDSWLRGMSFTLTSPMVMAPEVTSQNRAISLATVDFPPPEGPTSAVKLPCGRLRFTPRSTSSSALPV